MTPEAEFHQRDRDLHPPGAYARLQDERTALTAHPSLVSAKFAIGGNGSDIFA